MRRPLVTLSTFLLSIALLALLAPGEASLSAARGHPHIALDSPVAFAQHTIAEDFDGVLSVYPTATPTSTPGSGCPEIPNTPYFTTIRT